MLFDNIYQYYVKGGEREKLELKDIEKTLWSEAYNEKGECDLLDWFNGLSCFSFALQTTSRKNVPHKHNSKLV